MKGESLAISRERIVKAVLAGKRDTQTGPKAEIAGSLLEQLTPDVFGSFPIAAGLELLRVRRRLRVKDAP